MRGHRIGWGADLCVAAQTVSGKASGSKALESFCRDLCQQARDKIIDVVSSTKSSPQYSCLPLSEHPTALPHRQEMSQSSIRRHHASGCTSHVHTSIRSHVRQVIGRSKEVARVVQVLARRSKNNPILLGDPGVGKTAIAEGLARAIVTGPSRCSHPTPDILCGRQGLGVVLAD